MNPIRVLVVRLWPTLRLRTIIFGILLFVAALPGVGALYLRVYENALVRQTEAEIKGIGLSLAQTAALAWPSRTPPSSARPASRARPSPLSKMDLADAHILPDVGAVRAAAKTPDHDALIVAGWLKPALAEVRRRTGAEALVLDESGLVVSDRRFGDEMGRLFDVRIALGGRPATVLRRDENDPPSALVAIFSRAAGSRLEHVEPIVVGGRVVGALLIDKVPATLFDGLFVDRWKIALGIAVIFCMLLALTATLSRAIVRPLERLSAATRTLATGRGALPRRPSLTVVEIDTLYSQFRAMGAVINQRARYLRDFAASLSHEFKTPLTSLRGGVELLQDHGSAMTAEERARFLSNMAADTERLNRLLGRLMELAEADMTPADAPARCDLRATLAPLAKSYPAARISIDDIPAVAIDPVSVERVATILIVNSLQAGAAVIQIGAMVADEAIVLTFADDGPGVPCSDQTRIFEPFFTSKRESGGAGLGLAIARSLVEAQGGSLSLAPSDRGAVFEVRLARTP